MAVRYTPSKSRPTARPTCSSRERCFGCPLSDQPIVYSRGTPGGIAIVGEAPGSAEVRKGEPFVGASGKLLADIFKAAGADMDVAFITNATICHPPGNKPPSSQAIRSCQENLLAELGAAGVTKILAVGATALSALLGHTPRGGITAWRGGGMMIDLPIIDGTVDVDEVVYSWEDVEDIIQVPFLEDTSIDIKKKRRKRVKTTVTRQRPNIVGSRPVYVVPTYHPAAILRDEELFRDLAHDVEKFVRSSAPIKLPPFIVDTLDTVDDALTCLEGIRRASALSCDIESSGFDPREDDLWSIGVGALAQSSDQGYSAIFTRGILQHPLVKEALRQFFQDYPGTIVFHNAKFDLQWLWEYFGGVVEPQNVQDTMLLKWCEDERSAGRHKAHSLKTIARVEYDIPDYHFDFDQFNSIPESDRDWGTLYQYQGLDCYVTIRFWHEIRGRLQAESPKLQTLHNSILMPGSIALARAERRGVKIDVDHLRHLEEVYIEEIQAQIEDLRDFTIQSGREVTNFNSAPQLIPFFFDHLKLPGPRTTEKETLLFLTTSLKRARPEIAEFIEKLIDYRLRSKVLETYIRGLQKRVDRHQRVHPDFFVIGTSTNRLSCHNPNVQNIPTLMGPDIRKAFIVDPGWVWLDADESQLELRVAAFLAQDEAMIDAYLHDRDIHREVASKMFSKPAADITDYERYLAKYVDFGVIYQRTAQAVADGWEMTYYEMKYGQPKWTVDQAQFFIDEFLGGFPGLQQWIANQKSFVRKHQYVETYGGHRRRFPWITRSTIGAIERQAVNTPIQGTASQITFNALQKISTRFGTTPNLKGNAYVLMTVHDSIGMEVREEVLDEARHVVKEEMETAPFPMNVPLRADMKWGANWGDAKEATF